jgi:hypothetical protein
MSVEERAKEIINMCPSFWDKVYTDQLFNEIVKALKEQDKITRHACAENVENTPTNLAFDFRHGYCKESVIDIILKTKTV